MDFIVCFVNLKVANAACTLATPALPFGQSKVTHKTISLENVTPDEWWYALAKIAAVLDGHDLEALGPINGAWSSDEHKELFGTYIDQGVAAYYILAPNADAASRPHSAMVAIADAVSRT